MTCPVLSVARARDARCYFVCEAIELTQKVVQLAGHEFDDDAIDTGVAVALDFLDDCVDVALQGGLRIAVGNGASDARQHAHRHLELCLPSDGVDLGDCGAHLIWRLPEAVPAVSEGRCAFQRRGTVASDEDWDAR